jgi:Adenylate cyclase, family 3 (some proteins contain HAMP domain)
MGKNFTRSQKLKFQSILYICLFWAITSTVFAVYNHFFYLSTLESGSHYDFWVSVLTNILIIPLAGFLAGGTIVYFLKDRVRKLSLWQVIITDTLLSFPIIVITIPGSIIYNSVYFQKLPWDSLVIIHSFDFMQSYGLVYTVIFWTLVAMVTMVVLQVNDKYGQGVFLDLLRGRYHRPKVETRIFMFLDIRSSTSIAERLGHVKWFEFLNNFFNDITEPIIDTKGKIYQYVGDEIIISWDVWDGLEENNCIQCFFEIKSKMESLSEKYRAEYGVAPRFKAAIHCGDVATGEIGKIKKDIIFTGDVLNTTARIQELCNVYDVDVLVSQEVMDRITAPLDLEVKPVGYIELRGKQTPVSIFTIQEKNFASEKTTQAKPGKVNLLMNS